MIIPSNDAFIGNDNPRELSLFDAFGNLIRRTGENAYIVNGDQVWDAGTEVNDEVPENTAALAQAAPNTGVEEGGVVRLHEGFMGSNAVGGSIGNILQARAGADFTRPGAQVLRIEIVARNGTDVLIDEPANTGPALTNPGQQVVPTTQDTLEVVLEATDPDAGDTLTFSAIPRSGEYYLDQTLGLNFTGDLFQNFGGLEEKWVLGGNNTTWYYIAPDGNFYEWLGGGVLNRTWLAQLDLGTYADPSLLYDAQAGVVPPATATVSDNTLTLNPDAGFVGSFSVEVSVSDGSSTDSTLVLVNVLANQGPTLDAPGNQTLPTTQDTLDVALTANDPAGDPITYSVTVESGEYYLDQTLGLNFIGDLFQNWSGSLEEKWVLADSQVWYFITPDGGFWQWQGGDRNISANSVLVATLSPATYADPALLYDAQAGAAVPAAAATTGSTLTLNPNAGFIGTFSVLVTATDVGGLSDSQLVRVDVTAAAPVAQGAVLVFAAAKPLSGNERLQTANPAALSASSDESPFEFATADGLDSAHISETTARNTAFEELFDDIGIDESTIASLTEDQFRDA